MLAPATLRSFVNGAPSSATSDDDQIIRQVYADGLRTKYWVDLDPVDTDGTPDSKDQVTTDTVGTSKGTSRAHCGHPHSKALPLLFCCSPLLLNAAALLRATPTLDSHILKLCHCCSAVLLCSSTPQLFSARRPLWTATF